MFADASEIFLKTSDAVLILRRELIAGANPAGLALFGCADLAAMRGRPLADFSPLQQAEGRRSAPALADMAADAHRDGNRRFEWCWVGGDGRQFWGDVVLTSVAAGTLCAVIRDISARRMDQLLLCLALTRGIGERRRSEARTRHLAEHDFLTGLPNRVLLRDRLSLALAAARRHGGMLAILFLDLDHFKNVNDTLGHHVGDLLLREVAARLVKCVRGADTVSRQGGDEFVIILANLGGIDQAAHVAASILQAIGREFVLDRHALHISTSIGISIFPGDGADIDTLIKNADLAMYHAKESGRHSYQFFSPEMNAQIVERVAFEDELRRALAERQFVLAYEAQIDIASGRPLAAEALLRWRHPALGLLRPARFIGVAEDCGLMVPIGRWVLEQACREARRWHDAGHPLAVAINLSPTQFLQRDLADNVGTALAASGLPPALLELEFTEAVIMKHSAIAAARLDALRALGVRLAIDNFGTGYTRVGHLRDYPVGKLKIDGAFVGDIGGGDGATVAAIIAMAHGMGLTVLAEGVENAAQLRFLRQHGCDQYQGWYAAQDGQLDGLGGLLSGP